MTITAGSLVLETSTTTGTGSYTLLGAQSGFRAFDDFITPAATALVPYTARMGAEFERGIGLLSASATLQRIKVIESSNAGAAVNWAAGTKEIICAPAAPGSPLGLNTISASAIPTVSENYTDGYAEGSTWIVQGGSSGATFYDDVYLSTRAGIPGAANPAWMLAASHAFGRAWLDGAAVDAIRPIYCATVGYQDTAVITGVEAVVGSGVGAKSRWSNAHVFGIGYDNTDYGGHQWMRAGLQGETTNATPTKLVDGYAGLDYLSIELSSSTLFEITVVARDNATPDSKSWRFFAHVDRVSSNDPVLVDYAAPTVIGETGGAAAWDVDAVIDTVNDALCVEVTGAAGKTILWTASIEAVQTAAI
jgi:hypothetical protein